MRPLVIALALSIVPVLDAAAQDVPPPEGTSDAPPELAVPAIPEGYVLTLRIASNVDRYGPGPGESHTTPTQEGPPPMRPSDPAGRVALELGGAVVAVSASLALGYAVGLMDGSESQTIMTMTFAAVMIPTYTWLAGSIIGGGAGNWGGAFIGESIGLCIGGLFAWWAIEERSEEGMWTALLLVPSVGAILGLEVQHELRVARHASDAIERANDDVVVSMSVAPTPGGGVVSIVGSF
jgi:hypothetical protein